MGDDLMRAEVSEGPAGSLTVREIVDVPGHPGVSETRLMSQDELNRIVSIEGRKEIIDTQRREITEILEGRDDRFLAIIGPCGLSDIGATLQLFAQVRELQVKHADTIKYVIRMPGDKPRSGARTEANPGGGWSGYMESPTDLADWSEETRQLIRTELGEDNYNNLLSDSTPPHEKGTIVTRLMHRIAIDMGLATATELQYEGRSMAIDDICSLGWLGARAAQADPLRRPLALKDMPILVKNSTSNGVQGTVDILRASTIPQDHERMNAEGEIMQVIVDPHVAQPKTNAAVILRGADDAPNMTVSSILEHAEAINTKASHIHSGVICDVAHDNSKGPDGQKDPRRQIDNLENLAIMLRHEGVSAYVKGAMVEAMPERGQTKTDPVVALEELTGVLEEINLGVLARREKLFGLTTGENQWLAWSELEARLIKLCNVNKDYGLMASKAIEIAKLIISGQAIDYNVVEESYASDWLNVKRLVDMVKVEYGLVD